MNHPQLLTPTLELVHGAHAPRSYQVTGADFHIGRLPNLDLFIDSLRVSRPHARIQRRSDGGYHLVDLASQNGTYLEGKKLTPYRPARLRDGHRITIADCDLVFHHPGPMVEQPADDLTFVLGSVDDFSSDQLVRRSTHPEATLRALLDVIRAFAGGGELAQSLGRMLDGLMALFTQAERGFIVLAQPDGSCPVAAARIRKGPASVPSLSRTIRDRVVREGKAILIKDIAAEQDLEGCASIMSTVRSAICVPLLSHENRPIGMVQLDCLAGQGSFREQDLDLLAVLALPIGVAVENDRLLAERASWEVAREIQRALLPRSQPTLPDYTFWECYRPALEVGGDLYDYTEVEPSGGGTRPDSPMGGHHWRCRGPWNFRRPDHGGDLP